VYDTERGIHLECPLPGFDEAVCRIFVRHRFGYALEDGLIRKISSPALDDFVEHRARLPSAAGRACAGAGEDCPPRPSVVPREHRLGWAAPGPPYLHNTVRGYLVPNS